MAHRTSEVFPAYAGMSREFKGIGHEIGGFPRLRGDEPISPLGVDHDVEFSPPTRG